MSCRLDLVRVEESSSGVFGVLLAEGKAFCLTLEPPDLGNEPNVSCIPPGRYACRRVKSPRFGETFEVAGVPGRSHILFHAGNLASDTKGCILTGRRYGWVSMPTDTGRGLLDSRAAFQDLMDRLHGEEECHLVVHSWKQALLHSRPWETARENEPSGADPDPVDPGMSDRRTPERHTPHQPITNQADPDRAHLDQPDSDQPGCDQPDPGA